MDHIKQYIDDFESTDLAGLQRAALMKRVDTKFILNITQLQVLLESIRDKYQMLEINKIRANPYETLYFDTVDNLFFNDHMRGRPKRIKIRKRTYVNSNLTFLEVKQKNRKGKTIKNRIVIDQIEESITEDQQAFIKDITGRNFKLVPAVQNTFNRLTILNKFAEERATIDFNLAFELKSRQINFPHLVIVELKQKELDRDSPIYQRLRRQGIRPLRISKYCLGSSKLDASLKANMYKKKSLRIEKIAV